MIQLLFVLIFAFFAGLGLTPLLRWLSGVFGLVDHPDPNRKLHRKSTPIGGGLAVFSASVVGIVVTYVLQDWLQISIRTGKREALGLFGAASLLSLVGVLDDLYSLRGRQKVLGQLTAITVLLASSYRNFCIEEVSLFGQTISLGVAAIPLTYIWYLAAINALNLLDGADGMASTIGLILAVTVSALAMQSGYVTVAVIAASLAGAQLAFLVFNLPPATIFLGDNGSMVIGLVLGALTVKASLKGQTLMFASAPFAVMAIPFLDSGMAILRRKLTGRSIYATDRGHLHHTLLKSGLSHRRMLALVALLCFITSSSALLAHRFQSDLITVAAVAFVIGALVWSRLFGYGECQLLVNRLRSFGGSLTKVIGKKPENVVEQSVHLQGSRDWQIIWQAITEFAQLYHLGEVQFDLNIAWLHEGFHASWRRRDVPSDAQLWRTTLPIIADGRAVGRLEISAPFCRESTYQVLAMVAELLESLEPSITRLLASEVVPPAIPKAAAFSAPTDTLLVDSGYSVVE
jgi:UDP-GlcNAc:undecaprenyl-phosphate/decaprenyl-phosphate GlcNAc-1-phosphate transferase